VAVAANVATKTAEVAVAAAAAMARAGATTSRAEAMAVVQKFPWRRWQPWPLLACWPLDVLHPMGRAAAVVVQPTGAMVPSAGHVPIGVHHLHSHLVR